MTPMIYKGQINVAEREDMCYHIIRNTCSTTDKKRYGRYIAEIHYMPRNHRWESVELNANGYANERTAMAAIRRHAAKRGYTLIED